MEAKHWAKAINDTIEDEDIQIVIDDARDGGVAHYEASDAAYVFYADGSLLVIPWPPWGKGKLGIVNAVAYPDSNRFWLWVFKTVRLMDATGRTFTARLGEDGWFRLDDDKSGVQKAENGKWYVTDPAISDDQDLELTEI